MGAGAPASTGEFRSRRAGRRGGGRDPRFRGDRGSGGPEIAPRGSGGGRRRAGLDRGFRSRRAGRRGGGRRDRCFGGDRSSGGLEIARRGGAPAVRGAGRDRGFGGPGTGGVRGRRDRRVGIDRGSGRLEITRRGGHLGNQSGRGRRIGRQVRDQLQAADRPLDRTARRRIAIGRLGCPDQTVGERRQVAGPGPVLAAGQLERGDQRDQHDRRDPGSGGQYGRAQQGRPAERLREADARRPVTAPRPGEPRPGLGQTGRAPRLRLGPVVVGRDRAPGPEVRPQRTGRLDRCDEAREPQPASRPRRPASVLRTAGSARRIVALHQIVVVRRGQAHVHPGRGRAHEPRLDHGPRAPWRRLEACRQRPKDRRAEVGRRIVASVTIHGHGPGFPDNDRPGRGTVRSFEARLFGCSRHSIPNLSQINKRTERIKPDGTIDG